MSVLAALDTGSWPSALFSPCRTWRYMLARNITLPPTPLPFLADDATAEQWAARAANESRTVLFVMLNPSTADETKNDPTIRRCIGYAKSWGYRHLLIGNLFAFRATDPVDMRAAADPVGPDNDAVLLRLAKEADRIVCGWGNHGEYRNRGEAVGKMLRGAGHKLHALNITQAGQPEHPLYKAKDLLPFVWTP